MWKTGRENAQAEKERWDETTTESATGWAGKFQPLPLLHAALNDSLPQR